MYKEAWACPSMNKLCVLFLLVLLSSATHADDKNLVAIHGFDKMSCGDWMSSRDSLPAHGQYIAWIRGVVTGYNFANPDDQVTLGRMPDDISLAMYVDKYCRDRPLISFTGAAFALIEEMRGKPAPQEAKSGSGMDETKAFQHWVKQQSADMQSLGIDVLRNIYQKETASQSK
jgi:hypothetical protein